jgi:hypothetical protein
MERVKVYDHKGVPAKVGVGIFARIFMELYRRRIVKGLLLTSAIAGDASRMQQQMLKTVEILRQRYQYRDYIHLKILPGARSDGEPPPPATFQPFAGLDDLLQHIIHRSALPKDKQKARILEVL